ncbi:flagellar hook-associated protein FlgL [Aquipuribacter nitratireducens]|uniref:Flagellar hook-associated protein FlgL n=1 Tax=Aquipuribacter nitratireducens TaxID=650104 RepID=A0ABW0GRM1_9MICO
MLRITQRTMADTTYANLQASLARSSALQEQLSSGKRVGVPSDSPTGATDVLQLRSERAATDQHVRNADNGLSWLGTADQALQQASALVRRARDLTVQGGNGALPQAGRDAVARELRAARDGLLELANTQYLGRPVFGGTTAGGVAFDATGAYVGDGGVVERRVGPGSVVRVDADGRTAFGDGAASVFAVIDAVVADLEGGSQPGATRLADLDGHLDRVLGTLSDVGARANRIDTLKATATDLAITLRSSQSQIEDVDLPGTILELQLQQTAYQAALGATARVIQPTLLDFLR